MKLHVLQAIHPVTSAWNSVISDSIAQCFGTAGFYTINHMNVDDD